MSPILLDTHVVLWVLAAPERLGPAARELLERSRGVVSAATIMELTIKQMIGKLQVPDRLVELLPDQGLKLAAIEPEHAAALTRFPELARHDPFDRLLLAQATVEGYPFLTADRVLLGLGLDMCIDAGR